MCLTDSVLAFKKQNKLGRFGKADPGQKEKKEEAEHLENEKAKSITPGCRCLVTRSGIPPRKGMVKFVGKTEFADGWWIGVQYDEPVGKNDGRFVIDHLIKNVFELYLNYFFFPCSVKGKRYFECPFKYGAFIKPSCVEIGDFPEENFDEDDDEM